jgi:hypothetical protein
MTDDREPTQEERDAAAAVVEAFKKRQQEAQEAKEPNPLQATATRFPRRQ